jgi:SAM-dependent methyltransferase
MKWTTKAFIQRVLSRAPGGEEIYYLAQKYAGGFRNFTIDSKVTQGLTLLECFTEVGEKLEGLTAMEIGTGWTPIIPMMYWLHGQAKCHTFDTSKLLRPELVIETAKQLVKQPAERFFPDLQHNIKLQERLQSLAQTIQNRPSAEDILRRCNILYHAPEDASRTSLPDGSIDLIYSNTVLEHVPVHKIHDIFAECKRVLRSGGYMLHLIDLSDHFSHSDPSICAINFLQFSEQRFKKYNTRFIFQNRLRPLPWRKIFSEHEFEIIYWQTKIDEKAMGQLRSFPLDEAFKNLSPEEICTTAIHVVARKN